MEVERSDYILKCNRTFNIKAEDEILESWWFLSSPISLLIALSTYIAAVYFGPKFMKKRKPFDVTKLMQTYNIFQIIMNGYLLLLYYKLFGPKQFWRWWENLCCPVSAAQNFVASGTLLYIDAIVVFYINKLVDFMDTLFFILRKKDSQVTFLHVYHHVNMVVCVYLTTFVIREELCMLFVMINSAVHVMMYGYYFLSSLGPAIQKYLWWKKYITSIQMLQFSIALVMMVSAKIQNCPIDNRFFWLWLVDVVIFYGLFIRFYIKTYKTKTN